MKNKPMNVAAMHLKHDVLIASWQQNGDKDALAEILQDYEPLFKKLVSEVMRGRTLSLDHIKDLENECKCAAIKAINTFDTKQGTKLTTYLMRYVQGAMRRYVLDFRGPCRLGTSSGERKAYYAAQRLRTKRMTEGKETLCEDDVKLVARDCAVSEKVARRAVVSMNAKQEDIDSIADMGGNNSHAETTMDRQATSKAMALFEQAKLTLPPRTQDIICEMFLSHRTDGVAARLAEKHGLTVRRVRQIQKEGLVQLRDSFAKSGIIAEDIF